MSVSEKYIPHEEESARILDWEDRDGLARFQITAEDKGRDLLATLRYLHPDSAKVNQYLREILKYMLEKPDGNVLSHKTIETSSIPIRPDSTARDIRGVKFGKDPSFQEVTDVLLAYFKDEDRVRRIQDEITLELVDRGQLEGVVILVRNLNEMRELADDDQTAADRKIAVECLDLE